MTIFYFEQNIVDIFVYSKPPIKSIPMKINTIHARSQMVISPREKEVIQLIANEYSTKEIANLLFISTETVKSHRKNIRRKLNVRNVAGIVRVAFQSRLLQIQEAAAVA